MHSWALRGGCEPCPNHALRLRTMPRGHLSRQARCGVQAVSGRRDHLWQDWIHCVRMRPRQRTPGRGVCPMRRKHVLLPVLGYAARLRRPAIRLFFARHLTAWEHFAQKLLVHDRNDQTEAPHGRPRPREFLLLRATASEFSVRRRFYQLQKGLVRHAIFFRARASKC